MNHELCDPMNFDGPDAQSDWGSWNSSTAHDVYVSKELWSRIDDVLADQPEVARRLWRMVSFEGIAMSKASQLLDLSETQANVLLVRTNRRIRCALRAAQVVRVHPSEGRF